MARHSARSIVRHLAGLPLSLKVWALSQSTLGGPHVMLTASRYAAEHLIDWLCPEAATRRSSPGTYHPGAGASLHWTAFSS